MVLKLDAKDARLVAELFHNARASLTDIGEAIGLSSSACHRRLKALEEVGIIQGYIPVLNHKALGLTHEFLVEIALSSQSEIALSKFETAVAAAPEIVECRLMTGSFDYFLRIVARSPDDYERIHRHVLAQLPGVLSMRSSLALRTVRAGGPPPLFTS